MTPRNASAALARTVVDELLRGGVRHLVLSPGSRSAPLAFAAWDAARAGRVTLHTRIDERSGGFLALGLAKSSRAPVAVVTTSGTATANLHPAVLEASHAGVPVVVLTADRPAMLRGTGANQTTDQVNLYGGAARFSADVPPPHPGDEAAQVRSWRALVARALTAAATGPVHLNLQLVEPLTPESDDGWCTPLGGRPNGLPWVDRADPRVASLEPVGDDRRTVVLAGDDAGPHARMLAEVRGWPLLAEPSSGSRTGANAVRTYRLLLSDTALADRIQTVVVHGHPTLSRPVTRLLAREDVEVVVVRPPGRPWVDPGLQASRVLEGVETGLRWSAVAAQEGPQRTPTAWLQEWLDRDADLAARLDALLDGWPDDGAALTPHHVARSVAETLPPGGLLVVGASNPIRDLDLMVPRYEVGGRRLVLANRGLSGIDGTVSTAVGAALARPHSSRAIVLLGDLTFLHDANGLVLGPDEPRPDLMIVVVDDDGGSVFASLEQGAAEHAASHERLFGTPHGVDLAALCSATRTPHRGVQTRAALAEALSSPRGGIEVVQAVVRRDDRRALDAAVRALVSA